MKMTILAALAGLIAAPAAAATFTYDFTATKNPFGSTNSGEVTIVETANAFDTITGTLVLDDTFVQNASFGPEYAAPVITVDQFSMASASPMVASTVIDGTGSADILAGYGTQPTSGDPAYRNRVAFSLVDPSGLAFGSSAFPTSLNLADFSSATLAFTYSGINQSGTVDIPDRRDFTFTELTLRTGEQTSPVPLPAGLPLLLSGLAGSIVMRRRRS